MAHVRHFLCADRPGGGCFSDLKNLHSRKNLSVLTVFTLHIHTSMRRWIENTVIAVLVVIMTAMAVILAYNIWVYGWMY